jgi:hypothetical protein
MLPPGHQTQVAPPAAQQTSPISHSLTSLPTARAKKDTPRARRHGEFVWRGRLCTTGGGRIKIHTTQSHPSLYLGRTCQSGNPPRPVPKMSMRPASPRTRESLPQPASSMAPPPRTSSQTEGCRWERERKSLPALSKKQSSERHGGWHHLQQSSILWLWFSVRSKNRKNTPKAAGRTPKARSVASRALVWMWVGYFYDTSAGSQVPPCCRATQ